MKIRNGFVSNSSSTSFLVAFVPEPSNLNLKTFEFLLSKLGSTQGDMIRSSVADRKEHINEDIKNCIEGKEWLAGYNALLIECSKDKKSQLIFNALNDYWKNKKEFSVIDFKYGKENLSVGDALQFKINNNNKVIKQIDAEINKLNLQLQKIKDLPDDTMIAKWTEDNWGGVFGDLVNMLIEDGRIVVLEKTTT